MSSCIEIDFLLKIMEKMESGDIYESGIFNARALTQFFGLKKKR
ncbi:unnamed protein product [Larinioides sclopetarius]|uniref:Uncharacterized protein n=1 Tax=Larinioides sclopetarius TaxID=280406 RepID=A0AAV1YYN7_9ARAC